MIGKRSISVAMLMLFTIQIITVENKSIRAQEVIQDEVIILQAKQVAYTGCYCAGTDVNYLSMSAPVGQVVCGTNQVMYQCQPGCGWEETPTPCAATYCDAGEATFGIALDPIPTGQIICDKNGETHYCGVNGNWQYLGGQCQPSSQTTCGGGVDINGFALPNFPVGYYVCGTNAEKYFCDMAGNWQGMSGSTCGKTYCYPHNNGHISHHEPVPSGQLACATDKKNYFCDIDGDWRSLNTACTANYCTGGTLFNGKSVNRVINGRTMCGEDGTTYFCDYAGNYLHTNVPCKG